MDLFELFITSAIGGLAHLRCWGTPMGIGLDPRHYPLGLANPRLTSKQVPGPG
jgi:hypothetical protein